MFDIHLIEHFLKKKLVFLSLSSYMNTHGDTYRGQYFNINNILIIKEIEIWNFILVYLLFYYNCII